MRGLRSLPMSAAAIGLFVLAACSSDAPRGAALSIYVRADDTPPPSARKVEVWLRTPASNDFRIYRRDLAAPEELTDGVRMRGSDDPSVPQGAAFVRAIVLTDGDVPLGEVSRVLTLEGSTSLELVVGFGGENDGGVEAGPAEGGAGNGNDL